MFFYFNFEDDVEDFLKTSLYSFETYEKSKLFGEYIVDFYLPQGCRRLNYPPKTVWVLKSNLSTGVVFHAQKRAKQLFDKFAINCYCLMSFSIPDEVVPLRSSSDKSVCFRLIDFHTLKESINRYGTTIFENDDQWRIKRDNHLKKASQLFSIGGVSLFLGAGVSQDAGYRGWDDLLDEIVRHLRSSGMISNNDIRAVNEDNGSSLIIKARYLKRLCALRDVPLLNMLRKALYDVEARESLLVKALVYAIKTRKVSEIITYNFDDLIERALDMTDVPYSVLDKQSRPEPGCLPIFHVHGFISQKEDNSFDKNVVLSEDEYHTLYKDSFHWSNIEQLHALVQSTCFFIGLSMKDPNLRRLLDIANERGSQTPAHYAFLSRAEYNEPLKAEELLYEMGVNVIWFEEYNELPDLIHMVCGRFKQES